MWLFLCLIILTSIILFSYNASWAKLNHELVAVSKSFVRGDKVVQFVELKNMIITLGDNKSERYSLLELGIATGDDDEIKLLDTLLISWCREAVNPPSNLRHSEYLSRCDGDRIAVSCNSDSLARLELRYPLSLNHQEGGAIITAHFQFNPTIAVHHALDLLTNNPTSNSPRRGTETTACSATDSVTQEPADYRAANGTGNIIAISALNRDRAYRDQRSITDSLGLTGLRTAECVA